MRRARSACREISASIRSSRSRDAALRKSLLDGREFVALNKRPGLLSCECDNDHRFCNLPDPATVDPFIALVGSSDGSERLAEIRDLASVGHALARPSANGMAWSSAWKNAAASRRHAVAWPNTLLGRIAAEIPQIAAELTPRGRDGLIEQLRLGLSGQNTLIPVFHLIRTAMLQRSRGFTVAFSGLEDETPHDLLLERDRTRGRGGLRCGHSRGRPRRPSRRLVPAGGPDRSGPADLACRPSWPLSV